MPSGGDEALGGAQGKGDPSRGDTIGADGTLRDNSGGRLVEQPIEQELKEKLLSVKA